MKKLTALLIAAILMFSMMSFTTSAAVPTELTIKETKTAPNMKDGGAVDAAYGEKVFDLKASDHPQDSYNLFPSKNEGRDGHMLEDAGVKAAIAVMRNVGYMTYDDENLYILCEVTDVAPKASSNSEKYWQSTNLQLLMFINDERCFPTIAYEGTNKVKIWGDERSVLDYELVECTFTEKSQTNFVYEIKIPWNAVPDVDSASDVESFTMGIIQSSMANGYVCSAFGEAYRLDASYTIPVTLAAAADNSTSSNTSSGDKKEDTSSTDKSDDKKEDTSSTDKSDDKKEDTSSSNKSDEGDKKNETSDATDSTSAPATGTDIVTDNSSENGETGTTEDEDGEGSTTVITEEADRDWTPIIIIAVVAVVIIAGGAVAIIMLNKKPKDE